MPCNYAGAREDFGASYAILAGRLGFKNLFTEAFGKVAGGLGGVAARCFFYAPAKFHNAAKGIAKVSP
jgi:hypothetical protein